MSLYDIVRAYADLGDHRTGTAVDGATRRWFATELAARGAKVAEVTFEFSRYDVSWSLTSDGAEVDSFPLFYEGLGAITTDKPWLGELPIGGADLLADLTIALAEAKASRRKGVVLVTGGDHLVALDRAPALTYGLPTLCVSAPTFATLQRASSVHFEFDARLADGHSGTILGLMGEASDRPVIISTPLSGWFGCAGERGTGIAIAMELATRLAQRRHVAVVGTSGHELDHLGVRRWLAAWPVQPLAVIDIGAGVAACGLDRRLSAHRRALTNHDSPGLRAALEPAGLPLVVNPPEWTGEASQWSTLGVPMLCVGGTFPWIRTPADLPDVSTAPALLDRAFSEMSIVVDAFLSSV